MVNGPQVTVVITAYNYGVFLSKAIDSAIGQTYKNLEIVVIDDGSTDNTPEIARSYLRSGLINYVRIDNSGQAVAKNTGIRHASSEYVAFLDADDMWHEKKIEAQLPLFADPAVGVVYSRAANIDSAGNLVPQRDPLPKYLEPRSGRVAEHLIMDNFVPFSSSIVRKECFDRVGLFDESLRMGIDWDLWLRISPHYEFRFVDAPLLFYRIGHAGQMSKNLQERQRCSDRIMEKFLEAHPHLLPAELIKKAHAFTCCSRGEYYRTVDKGASTKYFLDAIGHDPAELGAYKGLLKNLLHTLGIWG